MARALPQSTHKGEKKTNKQMYRQLRYERGTWKSSVDVNRSFIREIALEI